MDRHHQSQRKPAPCIVDSGIIVNEDDIKRLLSNLSYVSYIHSIDDVIKSKGQGCIIEIFSDDRQATIVANGNLYINIQSFDFLQLSKSSELETYFDLIQDNRQLRLTPLKSFYSEPDLGSKIDADTIEAMMTKVLSARLDVQFDDDQY